MYVEATYEVMDNIRTLLDMFKRDNTLDVSIVNKCFEHFQEESEGMLIDLNQQSTLGHLYGLFASHYHFANDYMTMLSSYIINN